jgi:hypothetical protein
MEAVMVQILLQALSLDSGHIVDGLLLVVCFFVVMFMKDMKASLKEIHSMFLRHDRKITRLEERANVKDEE